MTAPEEGLKPCPFCGGTPVMSNGKNGIWCGSCPAWIKLAGASRQEIVRLWNTRPLLPEGGEGKRRKLVQAIGLLNSMVLAGEQHSELSRKIVRDAIDALSLPSPGEGVVEEVRKVGEQIFLGNNVYGKCKTCGADVHLRDGDIPVKTLWPFKDIIAILSRHLPKKG